MSKKILHIVNISYVLPYYFGAQFDYFHALGYQISVACSPSNHFFEYAKEKQFTPFPLEVNRSFSFSADLLSIVKLYRYVKLFKPDTIVGHTPKGAFIAMIVGFLARVPNRVYFRHGLLFETSKGLKRIFLITVEKFTGFLAYKVVCVSPSILDVSNKLRLSTSFKNQILNKGTCNGVDSEVQFNPLKINKVSQENLKSELEIPEDSLVLGYVGRLVKDKGIIELLEAWELVLKVYPTAILLLVGPFEDRDSIPLTYKYFIKDSHNIIHTDLVSDTTLYYSIMDAFILPSYREGFPTVVLEASAMELPIITTKSTGCIDSIVENETGVFTETNPNVMSNTIIKLFREPELRAYLGKSGREFVINNFKPKSIWEELEQLYKS